MTREEFERLVAEGFDRLPEWVQKKVRNVALLVEDEPSEEIRRRENLGEDETLLGYYHGIPLSERGEQYGVGATMPDTITLYQLPILEVAHADGIDVREVIADTVWHEFFHHFGADEDEVRAREDARNAAKEV
jgi:predicted Zn-dependent protease with MMP-like domain